MLLKFDREEFKLVNIPFIRNINHIFFHIKVRYTFFLDNGEFFLS